MSKIKQALHYWIVRRKIALFEALRLHVLKRHALEGSHVRRRTLMRTADDFAACADVLRRELP